MSLTMVTIVAEIKVKCIQKMNYVTLKFQNHNKIKVSVLIKNHHLNLYAQQ